MTFLNTNWIKKWNHESSCLLLKFFFQKTSFIILFTLVFHHSAFGGWFWDNECEEIFNCESTLHDSPSSIGFGGNNIDQVTHNLSSQGSDCPITLMNQYLRDCEDGIIFSDSTKEKIESKCQPIQLNITPEKLEAQIRNKLSNKNIPEISHCLKEPFTTEPFDSNPDPDVDIKTLPEDQHQAFITEYYANAQRLQDRLRSQFHNISAIDQMLGQTTLDCTEGGSVSQKIQSECQTLRNCQSSKEKVQENLEKIAKDTILALKTYYKLENEINQFENEINRCYMRGHNPKQCTSEIKKEKQKDKEEKQQTQQALEKNYPWMLGEVFKDGVEDENLHEQIKKLEINKDLEISPKLTRGVAKHIRSQLKDTREKLSDHIENTTDTYGCMIKNKDCENIKGSLFGSDSVKQGNMQKVLQGSPAIAGELLEEGSSLKPYFEHAQCRQNQRQIAEANQDFEKWGFLDAGLIVGSLVLIPFTGGTATATAIANAAARVGVRITVSAATKTRNIKAARTLLLLTELGATAFMSDDAFNTCTEDIEVFENVVSPSTENMCESLDHRIQIKNELGSCVLQASLATVGWAIPGFMVGRKIYRGIKSKTPGTAATNLDPVPKDPDLVANPAANAFEDQSISKIANEIQELKIEGLLKDKIQKMITDNLKNQNITEFFKLTGNNNLIRFKHNGLFYDIVKKDGKIIIHAQDSLNPNKITSRGLNTDPAANPPAKNSDPAANPPAKNSDPAANPPAKNSDPAANPTASVFKDPSISKIANEIQELKIEGLLKGKIQKMITDNLKNQNITEFFKLTGNNNLIRFKHNGLFYDIVKKDGKIIIHAQDSLNPNIITSRSPDTKAIRKLSDTKSIEPITKEVATIARRVNSKNVNASKKKIQKILTKALKDKYKGITIRNSNEGLNLIRFKHNGLFYIVGKEGRITKLTKQDFEVSKISQVVDDIFEKKINNKILLKEKIQEILTKALKDKYKGITIRNSNEGLNLLTFKKDDLFYIVRKNGDVINYPSPSSPKPSVKAVTKTTTPLPARTVAAAKDALQGLRRIPSSIVPKRAMAHIPPVDETGRRKEIVAAPLAVAPVAAAADPTDDDKVKNNKNRKKARSLKACSSELTAGSYLSRICALQARIKQLDASIAQSRAINDQLSLQLWGGVQSNVLAPQFITEMENFLKIKKLVTIEDQYLLRHMLNITILQERLDNNPNAQTQQKMNEFLQYFDQYIRNPDSAQSLDNSQYIRERIAILDQLTTRA